MRIRPSALGCAAAACVLLAVGQPSARAQGPGGPPPFGQHGGPRGGGMVQRLSQSLNLTPTQQAKLMPIFQAQRGKMMTIFSSTTLTPQQKFQKMRAMQQGSMARINAILTPAQRKKFAALRAQMRQRGPGMGRPGMGGPGMGRPPGMGGPGMGAHP